MKQQQNDKKIVLEFLTSLKVQRKYTKAKQGDTGLHVEAFTSKTNNYLY